MSGGQMRCPIVFRGPNGAASRVGAQHSQNYGPWYASVPGPGRHRALHAADAKGLLKAAIRSEDPVVFLENELLYGQQLRRARARRLCPADRQGADRARGQGRHAGQLFDRRRRRARGRREAGGARASTPRSSTCARCARSTRQTVLESLKPRPTAWWWSRKAGRPARSPARSSPSAWNEGFDDLDAPVLRVTNDDVPLPYAANLEKLALIKADDVVEGGQGGHSIAELKRDRDLVRLLLAGRAAARLRRLVRDRRCAGRGGGASTQPALGAIRLAWWREQLETARYRCRRRPSRGLQAAAAELAAARDQRRELAAAGGGLGGVARRGSRCRALGEERGEALVRVGAPGCSARDHA